MLEILWAPSLGVLWHLTNSLVHKLQIQVSLFLGRGALRGDNVSDHENVVAHALLSGLLAAAEKLKGVSFARHARSRYSSHVNKHHIVADVGQFVEVGDTVWPCAREA